MLDDFEDSANWVDTLAQLRAEHRDLDTAIAALANTPPDDGLMLPRLKKRKLALKDRIAYIERMIDPPELA
ncbi:MAG TPA: YdcH family protein [Denitromonas sp.]|uniref:YdcH family protein n=1 Tax=Denitromonas sp. TaxID=2734609 RepID=UPI001DEFD7F9|nr:YdcH family protein [Rhodocyclaceae bacterium]MCP5220667.1 YdcH family protein [Zoogloeaceae bacterium]HPR05933.1 YdcH family protein [Denitromonas sp.]HQU88064.1 YdcH family protein [Denitromonas sp.]HQV14644.1 YdcH family protein [Denitromonas sp.]